MSKSPNTPYLDLGSHLKSMREKRQESLAEVSGAVEIEIEALSRIESGSERPSEDILLLLISHFAVKEDEAGTLWNLAGYNNASLPVDAAMQDSNADAGQAVMVMPVDARVVYTDMVHVLVNNYGVVINFMQATGPNNQPLAVARVGMSKEHARSVIEVLQHTLAQSEKSLPAGDEDTSSSSKRQKRSQAE